MGKSDCPKVSIFEMYLNQMSGNASALRDTCVMFTPLTSSASSSPHNNNWRKATLARSDRKETPADADQRETSASSPSPSLQRYCWSAFIPFFFGTSYYLRVELLSGEQKEQLAENADSAEGFPA